MRKKITNSIWNALFVIIVLILIVPSWRVKFQSTVQKLFISTVDLKEDHNRAITIQPNEWIIYDLNNEPISFHEFGNKPVLLNFWATWCPSCIAELPDLYDFYEAIKEDVHVIAISNESHTQLSEFGAFKKYNGMVYRYTQTLDALDFNVYPTTFIFAPNFRLVSKIEGAKNFASQHNITFIRSLK